MGTMPPPPMSIPCIRVDGHVEQELGQVEDLRWPLHDQWQHGQDNNNNNSYSHHQQHQSQQHQFEHQAQHQGQHTQPQPPFKLVTDLSNFDTHQFGHQDHINSALERYVEDQWSFHAVPQSAPVRDFSPFEGCAWIPEPVSAITQYHDRLSSPDDTILSSASGSNYWPSSTFSSRFDGVSCSPASQSIEVSRRGSAFGSISAASDVHDPFAWAKNDISYTAQDTQTSQPVTDIASLGTTFAHPTIPASAQVSRHTTPFAMFNTDMDVDNSTRASSIPPQQPQPQHTHSLSAQSAQFRYPSPHDAHSLPVRQSLTPAGDALSDYEMPLKSDNDADSDYLPGRSLRSPRSRAHRQVRSTGHIRRPAYNAHARSSSYNAACNNNSNNYSPTTHRITKRTHTRRQSSNSHMPSYSPKTSSRHTPHSSHSLTSSQSLSSYHPGSVSSVPNPTVHPPAPQPPRPFTCPLTPYSCPKTFTSKNEWKRHVLTQHLLLGFWRCDLCPDVVSRPNDFNRKDLFVQHLRRMHCGDRRGAATVYDLPETADPLSAGGNDSAGFDNETIEQALERVRKRCWIQLRRAPKKLACAFCHKMFESAEGDGSEQERERGCSVEWLEHVGRHLVALTGATPGSTNTSPVSAQEPDGKKGHKRSKSGSSKGSVSEVTMATEKLNEPPWESDALLLNWLVEEGLVEERTTGNGWVLVDRGVASEAAIARREERDAEGDME